MDKEFLALTPQEMNQGEIYQGRILLPYGEIYNMPVAERFRLLRARIERSNLKGERKRLISITSSVPEEGKSVTSVNIARAFSTNPTGKTLLVDCDLRKPSVHKYFGLRSEQGLSDALKTHSSLRMYVNEITRGLDVLTAGSSVEDPLWLIDNENFSNQILNLKKIYNYIILDCPPVLLCPEPIRINAISDGTLLVVRGWRTERRLVKDALDSLGRSKLIGVVINGGSDSSRQYRYYRYYGYMDMPSEESIKSGKRRISVPSFISNIFKKKAK